jgi:hypothetical protein
VWYFHIDTLLALESTQSTPVHKHPCVPCLPRRYAREPGMHGCKAVYVRCKDLKTSNMHGQMPVGGWSMRPIAHYAYCVSEEAGTFERQVAPLPHLRGSCTPSLPCLPYSCCPSTPSPHLHCSCRAAIWRSLLSSWAWRLATT